MRRLQLSNARCVAKYQQRLKQLLRKHNLFHRQYTLEQEVIASGGAPLTEAQAKEAEAIDNLRTRCMLQAEKQCRKFRTGEVDYSPTTAMPARAMRYWYSLIRRSQGLQISLSKIKKLKQLAGIHEPTALLTEQDMWARYKEARTLYSEAKKAHKEFRLKYLDTFTPKERDRLKRVEEQRRQGRICKMVNGKLRGEGISTVAVGSDEAPIVYVTQPQVEAAIIAENQSKYSQCLGTPPMQPPFTNLFGYTGDTPAADQVLAGTFQAPPDMDPALQTFLQHCKAHPAPEGLTPCPNHVTTEDNRLAWKKAKEHTQAGLSGLDKYPILTSRRRECLPS